MWFDWSPSLTVTQLIRLYSFGLASKMHKLKNRPKDQRKNLTFHQTGGVNQGNLWSSAISAFSWSYKKIIQSHSIKFYVTFSRGYTVSLAMRAFSCFSSYTQKSLQIVTIYSGYLVNAQQIQSSQVLALSVSASSNFSDPRFFTWVIMPSYIWANVRPVQKVVRALT